MKIWLLLVVVLIVLSCDAKKKRKKKKTSKKTVSRWQGIIRGRTTTPKPTTQPPTTITQPTVSQPAASNDILDLAKSIDSVEKFYQVFKNVSRLPQHLKGKEQSGPDKVVDIRKEMYCSLQESLVKLPSPRFGEGFIWPPCAILTRCKGCCRLDDYTTCQPVAVHMKPVYYYHITDPSLQVPPKITSVEMEVHDACNCGCIATRDSCDSSTQFWNQGHCRCECNQKSQEQGCGKDFKFDEETCGCICKKAVEICAHNKEWDHKDCGCVCKNTKSCPRRTHSLNPETCDCVEL